MTPLNTTINVVLSQRPLAYPPGGAVASKWCGAILDLRGSDEEGFQIVF